MRRSENQAHVILVTYPSYGNINPLLRFGKQLASKGLSVTVVCTHDIASKIYASTNTTPGEVISIGRGNMGFDFFYDGFDIDDNVGRISDFAGYLLKLSVVGSASFKELVLRQAKEGRPVSCIINSPFVPWAFDVAQDLNISSAVLWVQSSSVYSIYYHYFKSLVAFSGPTITIPGLPPLNLDEIPSFITGAHYKCLQDALHSQFANIHKAKWVFVNSFLDLESDAINGLSEHSTIIPVGPLVDIDKTNTTDECIQWLDTQELQSVVYVSLGSVAIVSEEEMVEMAEGLVDSKRPFVWVVREECEHLLPKEFVEGILGKGIVVRWSPQDQVLNHHAVGCFVTHCGWNSTVEALAAGVPVVTYPMWGDQLVDSKFLVEVYKVGVRLKNPVERRDLVMRVDEVVGNEDMRKRCLELKEAARSAVEIGGSSDRNIQAFRDEIRRED